MQGRDKCLYAVFRRVQGNSPILKKTDQRKLNGNAGHLPDLDVKYTHLHHTETDRQTHTHSILQKNINLSKVYVNLETNKSQAHSHSPQLVNSHFICT